MISTLLSAYFLSALQQANALQKNPKIETQTNIIRSGSTNIFDFEEFKNFPLKKIDKIKPLVNAKSALAMDLNTGVVLFEQNIHQRLPIASITKLMTILILLEENDLEEIVTISKKATQSTGSIMYLQEGEKIALKNLILGMLIHSANDAAIAAAEHNAGNVEKFVEKMNEKSLQLGLLNTNFANPVGLDDPKNYSSSYDLAKLSKYIYQKQFIKKYATAKEITVQSQNKEIIHKLQSTNDLLGSYLHIKGLKTGSTEGAGLCLISIAENSDGNEILSIVLNSPSRFLESKIILDWTFNSYTW